MIRLLLRLVPSLASAVLFVPRAGGLLLALLLVPICAAGPAAGETVPRCCMTDGGGYYGDAPDLIARRFALYRQIGVRMLRVEIGWRNFETSDGHWDDGASSAYLDAVQKSGFDLKLIVGTIMAPPRWFLDAHPEARIVNQDGGVSYNTVSYWYPGLHDLLERKATQQFEFLKRTGLLKRTRLVIADFGPAGEPIYPAMWTLGPGFTEETFFCYDDNARNDFRTKMRAKYATVGAANAAWKTEFRDWSEVGVPKPGTHPGRFWEDVLTWYRDAKRDFVVWQIRNFQSHVKKYLGNRAKVLVYVPGSDIRDEEWADAVRTGSGDASVRLMADSRWLLTTAVKMGCVLQYTGAENRAEVEHLRAFLDANGMRDVSFWAENAGVEVAAADPLALADIVLKNRLLGLDFTHSHFLFGPDHITPNAILPLLRQAYAKIAVPGK